MNNSSHENNQSLEASTAEDSLYIVSITRFLLKHLKELGFITSFFAVLSIVFALFQDNYYSSQVTMIEVDNQSSGLSAINSLSSNLGGLPSLIGLSGLPGGGTKTSKAFAIANSRTFIEEFIEQEDILTVLFEEEWDEVNSVWLDEDHDLYDGYMIFKHLFKIDKDKKTNVLQLSVEWKNPLIAARWANLLFKKINEALREKDLLSAENNILYLESQLKIANKLETQNALFRMIEQQSKTKMLANVQEEYIFELIDKAIPAKERSKPERKKIVITGTLIGFIFSISLIFIREYFVFLKKTYKTTD